MMNFKYFTSRLPPSVIRRAFEIYFTVLRPGWFNGEIKFYLRRVDKLYV